MLGKSEKAKMNFKERPQSSKGVKLRCKINDLKKLMKNLYVIIVAKKFQNSVIRAGTTAHIVYILSMWIKIRVIEQKLAMEI